MTHKQESVTTQEKSPRERFIPVSRFALLDRLRHTGQWNSTDKQSWEQLFQYLALWKHQKYRNELNALKEAFLPFSPDRDTKTILKFSASESIELQQTLLTHLKRLLNQANYREITVEELDDIFSSQSPYGLQLKVDLSEFEEILLFARGANEITKSLRDWKSLYLKKISVQIPIYQRLFLLLKLKPAELRITEIMRNESLNRKKANKRLARYRANLPDNISGDHIFIKLFKNIPQADLEMLFPNTQIKLKMFDKLKLGATAGGGTLGSVAATATKLTAAANPMAAAAALAGLAGVIFRQVMKFFGQRTKYMMVLAQNLYFHNLANNRAALTLLTDRAEEEEIKNTLLAYFILNQSGPAESTAQLQARVETYVETEFGVNIQFDVGAALSSLREDRLIAPDTLTALPPADVCRVLETHWQEHMKTLTLPDSMDNADLEA